MNTIVLAAGGIDHRNMSQGMTSSPLLSIVNGRPAISWVLRDILKNTQDPITVVINPADAEMRNFLDLRYARRTRVRTRAVTDPSSIVHSILGCLGTAKDLDGPVRINLGDTLLQGVPYMAHDTVYVSDFPFASQDWCLAELDRDGDVRAYHNKQRGLFGSAYKAVVGRYEFSCAQSLHSACLEAIRFGKCEISDILEIYAHKHPVVCRVVPEEAWIDFGHLSGLSKARARLIESRHFNELKVHPVLPEICKRSKNSKKIEQEAFWYKNLPEDLLSIAPRIFSVQERGAEGLSMRMEYYGYGTLAERFIYFDLPESFWASALGAVTRLLRMFRDHVPGPKEAESVNLEKMYLTKTHDRLNALRRQGGEWAALLDKPEIEINSTEYLGFPALLDFVERRIGEIIPCARLCVVHGDLCFNNILYDVRTGALKLIDPRGEFGGGEPTIYGDPRYDLAKLRHSFCGNYDSMIEGDFDLSVDKGGRFDFFVYRGKQASRDTLFDRIASNSGYNTKDIHFIEAILFLSMIPLHADSMSRQKAFFLTAIQKLNACQKESS